VAAEIAGSGVTANVIHPGDVKTAMWADIKAKATELGNVGKDFLAWVKWVEETGGDDPGKASELILKIVSKDYDHVNGKFLWINKPLQSPIPSWDEPEDLKPWN
jgi:NAD(P)-dependent dehydrogenase (short-subunit alcohol dehydrogenase family)